MSGYSFFGVQVAIGRFHERGLRDKLHALIKESAHVRAHYDKRAFWKRFTDALSDAGPDFHRGYWDLVRGAKAEAEFETWSSEIESAYADSEDMASHVASRALRALVAPATADERRYLLVTMIVLVGEGTNADLTLGERCEIPERHWQTRYTYLRLVATPPCLNFTNVRADAVYLVPGNDAGLTEAELASDYKYLNRLE